MRKTETSGIRELVDALMKAYGADDKIAEVRLIRAWEELLGKGVGRFTKNIYIREKVLYVTITSSIVKTEVSFIKDELIQKLNEKAGKHLINRIVIK